MTDPRFRYGRYQGFAYPTTADIDSSETSARSCANPFSLRLISVVAPTLRVLTVTPATPDYVSESSGAMDSTHLDAAALDMTDTETEAV